MKKLSFSLLFLALLSFAYAGINPVNLRCEYLEDPMGIDMQDPRFFWQCQSDDDGQMQSAYQLIVATTGDNIRQNIGDAFDSKKVRSGRSIQIVYKGESLNSASVYFWKVRVWDQDGQKSSWSKPASFTTGLFREENWKGAQWIAWRPQEEWAEEWWRKKEIEKQCYEFHLPGYFGARMSMWERYHFYHDSPHDPAPLLRKFLRRMRRI